MKSGGLITTPWKLCVVIALVLVIFEGAIRKWLLPGLSEAVYFAKDGVLGVAYFLFFLKPRKPLGVQIFAALVPLLVLAVTWVAFQIFNSALGSVIVGVFGARCFLWYIPLTFMVPYLFEDARQLERFLRLYLLILIPVCVLGITQFFSAPSDDLINRYAASEGIVVAFSDETSRVRITGTFAYITGHATYLQVMAAFVLALFGQRSSVAWFAMGISQFILIAGNTLMSGSRGPALLIAGMTVAFLGSTIGQRSLALRRFRLSLTTVAILTIIGSAFVFRDAWSSFKNRMDTAGDTEERLKVVNVNQLNEILDAAGIGGFGAGATQPGGDALRRFFNIPAMYQEPPGTDAEYLSVMLELGPIGFVAWYGLRFYLLWVLWFTWKNLRHPLLRQLGFAALMIHLVSLPQSLVLNSTFNVYYWFVAGFIFLLPRLEAKELQRLKAVAVVANRISDWQAEPVG